MRSLALAAAAVLTVPAFADDLPPLDFHSMREGAAAAATPAPVPVPAANPSCVSRGFPTGGECRPDSATKFCRNAEECERFCCCSMSYDFTKWTGVYDWKTTNVSAPLDIPGAMRPDDAGLTDLGAALPDARVLTGLGGKVASAGVVAGLRRLDAALAADPDRASLGYTVAVKNCYRRAIGNGVAPLSRAGPDANAEAVCGELFTMMHFEDLPARTEKQERVLAGLHSGRDSAFLMAWPGLTPHASGNACDLVLRDSRGADCFDARAGVDGAPTCAIDARRAVGLLTRAVAAAGGARLDYEAWHFEWGGATGAGSCRCSGADCESIWPVSSASGCP